MRASSTASRVPAPPGATLRVYIERYEAAPDRLELPVADVLGPVVAVARELADIEAITGRAEPSVVT
ncbi:protein of unknown function [Methylorubrum extorquens]|uniref:Uncharacterized protein n=1 Tax=Methylorubrum extorquens TaxID=408 RepID=A0A2N9AQA2_METEX|nr:protein of unknown function [Methylorubrum extorquens]